jgi:hypothetical protein
LTFDVTLPLPPSVNAMFVRARLGSKVGKAPSPQYRKWKLAARDIVMNAWNEQDKPIIGKPYAVHIRVNVDHKGDIANREKALTDILVATIPGFPDDCWANRVLIERDRTVDGAHIEVVTLP